MVTQSGAAKAVWAAFWHRGVWRRSGGAWAQVAGIPVTATAPGRTAFAAASEAANANDVYALAGDGSLHRFDGTRFRTVGTTPPALVSGQGWYDLAVAVAPGTGDTVIVGGDTVKSQRPATQRADWEASLYTATVTAVPPTWNFGFAAANNARNDHYKDPTYIGDGIHADVHRVCFGQRPNGTPDPNDVWIGCDGGIFRSEAGITHGAVPVAQRGTGLDPVQLPGVAPRRRGGGAGRVPGQRRHAAQRRHHLVRITEG